MNQEIPQGNEFFGWKNGRHVYAQAATVWHLLQVYYQREDSQFPVGQRTLWKLLAKAGVIIYQNGEHAQPLNIPSEDKRSIRVLKFSTDRLFGSQALE